MLYPKDPTVMKHVSFKGDVTFIFIFTVCKKGQTMVHMPNLSLKKNWLFSMEVRYQTIAQETLSTYS